MQFVFDRVSPTRYIVMRNGSRWEPAPGEGDIIMAWQPGAKIQVRGLAMASGWNYQLTNMDTGETIIARKDE